MGTGNVYAEFARPTLRVLCPSVLYTLVFLIVTQMCEGGSRAPPPCLLPAHVIWTTCQPPPSSSRRAVIIPLAEPSFRTTTDLAYRSSSPPTVSNPPLTLNASLGAAHPPLPHVPHPDRF